MIYIIICVSFLLVSFIALWMWSRFQEMIGDKEDETKVVELAKLFYPEAKTKEEALELLKWNLYFRIKTEENAKKAHGYKVIIKIINNILQK